MVPNATHLVYLFIPILNFRNLNNKKKIKGRHSHMTDTQELYNTARSESILTYCYNGNTRLLKWCQNCLKAFRD